MAATPTRFPYRLTRDVMVAAAVLYCSLLLELAAGFPAASLLLELAAGFPATSTLAGIGSVAMGIFAGSRYWIVCLMTATLLPGLRQAFTR